MSEAEKTLCANVRMRFYKHIIHTVQSTTVWGWSRRAAPPLLSSPHVDFLCLVFTHLSPAPSLSLSLSLIPNLTPKMQAVYLHRAEAIPLSSPTRCFIPKRDLFSKINGERKGTAKVIFTMTWNDCNKVKTIQIRITAACRNFFEFPYIVTDLH